MKKIYLVSQNHNNNWDTYDSMVVCAESEDDAREVSYQALGGKKYYDYGYHGNWLLYESKHLLEVQYIGLADQSIEKGAILKSYNKG